MSVSPILALLPENKYAWTLDHHLQPFIAQIPTSLDEDTQIRTPTVIPATEIAITTCPSKDGNVWVLYDDLAITDRSVLRKFAPDTGIQIGADIVVKTAGTLIPPASYVRIGELGAYKSLMEADCGRILTVDRNRHEVVLVKVDSQDDALTPGIGSRTFPLSTLTSSGAVATATKVAHGIPIGSATVTIEGADPSEYNGSYVCTIVDENTFTYAFAGGASPATGFITATVLGANDNEIGMVVKRLSLSVDPLDAAINAAATRLLYRANGAWNLWDLEEDAFIRAVLG